MTDLNSSDCALLSFGNTDIYTTADGRHEKHTILFLIGLQDQSVLSNYDAFQVNAFRDFYDVVISGDVDGRLDCFVGAESGVHEQSQRFGGQWDGRLFLGQGGREGGQLRF